MNAKLSLVALAAGFFLLGSQAALAEGDAANGEKIFRKCHACHSIEAGKNKVGPSLHGVVGRTAGTEEGFRYSDAMKNSGIVWDEQTLNTFLTKPKALVPGTRMSFPGLKDEQDRLDVIAYLKKASQ